MGTIKTRTEKLIKFIKKAPKAGRTYTDMLKYIVDIETGGWAYERNSPDRGMIAHCMDGIRRVTRKFGRQYIYCR